MASLCASALHSDVLPVPGGPSMPPPLAVLVRHRPSWNEGGWRRAAEFHAVQDAAAMHDLLRTGRRTGAHTCMQDCETRGEHYHVAAQRGSMIRCLDPPACSATPTSRRHRVSFAERHPKQQPSDVRAH